MPSRKSLPIALTIAGSDSGGGAGIQADLKTFASLGVHGATAITCLTAQNPRGVRCIQACRPEMVLAQIEAVFDELPPAAVKTGMLYSAAIVNTVAAFFKKRPFKNLAVDPVMVATSGACLLKPQAIRAVQERLLPLAAVVTPNLPEAELLTGIEIAEVEDLRTAARLLHRRFGCAALVKGGHLGGLRQAVDVFYDGREELLLVAPFIEGVSTHGTGCTYSAAITACLALGKDLARSVELAKRHITAAIAGSVRIAGHQALNPLGI